MAGMLVTYLDRFQVHFSLYIRPYVELVSGVFIVYEQLLENTCMP